MKTLFLIPIIALVFFVGALPVQADTQATQSVPNSFSINVSDITYYKDIKKTQFFVNIEEINNPQNIAYWKVKTSCDDKMTIQIIATSTNDCGKTIRFNSLPDNVFSFLFKNKTSKSKDFSIKVKAFDKYGKGLHTEKKGFGWK